MGKARGYIKVWFLEPFDALRLLMASQAENVLSDSTELVEVLSKDTPTLHMLCVYILQNCVGKFYVGVSKNPKERLKLHNKGKGAKYTSDYKGFQIVYKEEHKVLADACRRERQLKGWSRAKKKALISGNIDRLQELSRSKS